VDGLEVWTKNGEWISAPAIPNTVLVNSGDIMQTWTKGLFKSTKHRVIETPQNSINSRYSIVYFCVPNWECSLSIETDNSETKSSLLVGDLIPFI